MICHVAVVVVKSKNFCFHCIMPIILTLCFYKRNLCLSLPYRDFYLQQCVSFRDIFDHFVVIVCFINIVLKVTHVLYVVITLC